MSQWLINSWYQRQPVRWLLWPLSLIYQAVLKLRRELFRLDILKQRFLPVPVIIVGNITIGGTGKTPFVIWLAKQLQQAGYRPGIISRGYGGKAEYYPQKVMSDSDPSIVGDEPIIISRHTLCPMVVAPDRLAAGMMLLRDYDCNIIIADDGLQHYALGRDIEIVIIDGQRQFGNQLCLPAGPLREPLSRLQNVDFIIENHGSGSANYTMTLSQLHAINLADPTKILALTTFTGKSVHAIAGIGNPQRFFDQLSSHGLLVISHAFDDHHRFQTNDLDFNDNKPILMTEKDAVKCQKFANSNTWYIPIEASISGKLDQHILQKLAGITSHG
ncbi:MAG: tetraacyldisaccharide 4'-kinase [Pseudomonadota bacterium]|nr:tetraacyldisaccharide 4'-kinase [Pseudomonadota bacterium]MDO7710726.1 tetraacyldisaccharide 4'-kinase [Pseudomonadota bacterium]